MVTGSFDMVRCAMGVRVEVVEFAVPWHSVELGASKLDRETVSGRAKVKVARVGEVFVEWSANRYRHSSGLSEWRGPFLERLLQLDDAGGWRSSTSGLGDVARDAIRGVLAEPFDGWRQGVEYGLSRRRAVTRAVVRVVRDGAGTGYGWPLDTLQRFGDELGPNEMRCIRQAAEAFEKGRALLVLAEK